MSARHTPLSPKSDTSEFNRHIAAIIRERRERQNITQNQLGIEVQCAESRIRKIEQGLGGNFELICRIFHYFKIPFDEIPTKFFEEND